MKTLFFIMISVSVREWEKDKIIALDDYLTRLFATGELRARLRCV